MANITAVSISGAIGIALAFYGFGIWALVAQVVSQAVVACAVMAVYASWHYRFEFDPNSAKELFSFGWKVCTTGILNVLYIGISELILGKACSAADLGL